MSERFTTIRSRNEDKFPVPAGLTERGRVSRKEMIARMRQFYQRQLSRAQQVLDTPDEDFIVETHVGIYERKDAEEVTE